MITLAAFLYFFWKLLSVYEDGRFHGPVTNTHSACKTLALGSLERLILRFLRRPREGEVEAAGPGKVTPPSVS